MLQDSSAERNSNIGKECRNIDITKLHLHEDTYECTKGFKYSLGLKTEIWKPNAILLRNFLKVGNGMFRFWTLDRSKSERK